MCRRNIRRTLLRLGPPAAAALIFALVAAPGALAGSGPNVIANPGFETGNFCGGGGGSDRADADVTPLVAHSGRYSAVIGYPYRPANLSSFITQVVAVPFDRPTLTFFIRPQCTPSATDDESFRLLIRNMSTGLFV